eukprot:TRINITY_DN13039_c0_g1_i3.p1 TRINITY_DN13039_c0_g1~~TRINITY_DN13039_c0_g1_i3.p1  ORF type:complete len:273 (+),score=84.03 TRINITY_DN13039_c0_g1_i3:191-1009(+)
MIKPNLAFKPMTMGRAKSKPSTKYNIKFVDKKALESKIREGMKKREELFLEFNTLATTNKLREQPSIDPSTNKESAKEVGNVECSEVIDISCINRNEPSEFVINYSLIEPLKEMSIAADNKCEENCEDIDEYFDTSNRNKNSACTYDEDVLVDNEGKIDEYMGRLAKVEEKYRELLRKFKEEKLCSVKHVIDKCLGEKLSGRSKSTQMSVKYKEVIDEYKKTKRLLEEQQIIESDEILKEYREFHKSLHLSLIHICRCRRYAVCRSRWSPYH